MQADIDVRANKMFGSALAIAAYHGNTKSVKYLIERGADVDDASQVLKGLADDKNERERGGKEGLALLRSLKSRKLQSGFLKIHLLLLLPNPMLTNFRQ